MFLVSPGVSTRETDLSSIIPNTSASDAGAVGQFAWGPVDEIVQIDNEDMLVSVFGKPTSTVYKDFMTSSSFLAYAGNLKQVRVVASGALNASATASAAGSGLLIKNRDAYDAMTLSASPNLWIAKHPGLLGNAVAVAWVNTVGFNDIDTEGNATWPFSGMFAQAPANNEFHVVVYDASGAITGTAGSVLEKYEYVSTQVDAKNFDGTSAYFKEAINTKSAWVWVGNTSLLVGTSNGVTLGGGSNGAAITNVERIAGWTLFQDTDNVDVSLLIAGDADSVSAKWIIDNIAEVRKDCVVFVSPMEDDVVSVTPTVALNQTKITRTSYGSTSYALMDSAYKLMYDRYNDVNRWVPLNGDIAGLEARATNEQDAWWSPAGYDRGRIKNCIKLSYVQSQSIRDELYKAGINPCIVKPSTGPILYGDKTLQTKPSAFDRIGVRRLFIVLEKAIANAAQYQLFNFNDDITRAKFTNMVEPFLDTVKGRRGLTKFKVVCDKTNNTEEVIARNEFVAQIWILPNYSINYIMLDFVAVNSSVLFDETVVR